MSSLPSFDAFFLDLLPARLRTAKSAASRTPKNAIISCKGNDETKLSALGSPPATVSTARVVGEKMSMPSPRSMLTPSKPDNTDPVFEFVMSEFGPDPDSLPEPMTELKSPEPSRDSTQMHGSQRSALHEHFVVSSINE